VPVVDDDGRRAAAGAARVEGRASNGTEVASRVGSILALFVTRPGSIGVSEASRELGLSKAVVHRILQSLLIQGLVTTDTDKRRYRLGPLALALGARAYAESDLRRAALPTLHLLAQETRETATVSYRMGLSRVYLDQAISDREMRMSVEIGRPYPLHGGSSGKAILAFCDEDLRNAVLDQLTPITPTTITDRASLEQELAEIRRRRVAVSFGERQLGAASVAAPVFGVDDFVIGSLSVCGPVGRFTDEVISRLATLVPQAADAVSERLRRPTTHRVPAPR
jgi:IclR family acetate operon transcriptional repressor